MGKFENEYQSNQIAEWKEKYIDYISLKKTINKYTIEMTSKDMSNTTQIEKDEILSKYSKEFTELLDKEIRKVYVLFSKTEKHLYKDINKYLHIKEEYTTYSLDDYLTQYSELKDLTVTSLKMSKYVFYNLKCLIKILTKFDKKIIGSKDKENQIKNDYIITKLEDQNSDILYLINFKILDEVNVIVEDLIKCLKDNFKLNKNKFINSIVEIPTTINDNKEENLIEKKTFNLNETAVIIDCFHAEIKENLKNIDKMSNNIIMLFMPWKEFLRISGDISSKLIQLSKELNNFSDSMASDDITFKNNKNKSIIETISFSKQNSYNIYITLCHGFIYMFSFSCVIPSYPELIAYPNNFWETINKQEDKYSYSFFCGLLMMMAPLGAFISYIYESSWFKSSTKIQIVLSCLGLFFGNLFYYISIYIEPFLFIFIGRIFIGVFNLRTHNKMYLMNFLLRKDVSYYLTLFHTFSMFGLSFGFLINSGSAYLSEKKNILNKYTFGSLISSIFSITIFIISLKLFTEARSSHFNMTSMKSFVSVDSPGNGGLLTRESSIMPNLPNGLENDSNKLIAEEIMNEEFTEDVKRKSIMVSDINDQLGDYNRKSNFNDTNLVSISVSQLTYKEKEGLQYLFKSFLVYLSIVFTTKFINECIFINLPIFILNKKNEIDKWIIPFVLGISCLVVLVVEFSLKNKNKFITEKSLLIILLVLNLINNLILVFLNKKYNIFYFIIIGFSLILSNIVEKYATHFFNYIIPHNYIICKIQGNTFINVVVALARIIASILIMCFSQYDAYEIIIFVLNLIFSIICSVLFFVFHSDLRIKSMSRIMTKQDKDEIKIATEI